MRKIIVCVLTMLLLLTGCEAGGGGDEAQDLALTIRAEYLALENWTANCTITADYGQRIYEYGVTAAQTGEDLALTLTSPETVAGLTARISGENGLLEYDGASLETGPLDGDGLSPVSALPALLHAAKEGYMDSFSLNESLMVLCRDPEKKPGEGTETSLWFDPDSHALLRGEISQDGFMVIQCDFSNFVHTTGGTHGDTPDNTDLGGD